MISGIPLVICDLDGSRIGRMFLGNLSVWMLYVYSADILQFFMNLSKYPFIACNVEIFGNSPADKLSPVLADFGLVFYSF